MSNNNKPTFRLPGGAPPPIPTPPPPPAAPGPFTDLLATFPLPWVVGPYGDIWVASDVEQFDPDKVASREKVQGPKGSWWRSTCAKPRRIMENPGADGIAALIVAAVNKFGAR